MHTDCVGTAVAGSEPSGGVGTPVLLSCVGTKAPEDPHVVIQIFGEVKLVSASAIKQSHHFSSTNKKYVQSRQITDQIACSEKLNYY